MITDIKFRRKLKWEDYRGLFLKNFLVTPIILVLAAICFYNISCLLVEIYFDTGLDIYGDSNPLTNLAFFTILLVSVPIVYMLKTKSDFDSKKHLEINFVIGLNEFSYKSELESVQMKYQSFRKIENNKGAFIFYLSKRSFLLFKKEEFEEDKIIEIHRILSKQSNYINNC